jgi:hypothetical protein
VTCGAVVWAEAKLGGVKFGALRLAPVRVGAASCGAFRLGPLNGVGGKAGPFSGVVLSCVSGNVVVGICGVIIVITSGRLGGWITGAAGKAGNSPLVLTAGRVGGDTTVRG